MGSFFATEWNALINRARAHLAAQARCPGETGGCGACPFGDAPGVCRTRFRWTTQQLAGLVQRAPATYRLELRRTLDSLQLSYRGIWAGAAG
jgi:hypothetical protein